MKKPLSTISVVRCTACGKKKRLINMSPEGLNRLNTAHQAFTYEGGDACSGHFEVESSRGHSVDSQRLCEIPGCGNTTRRHGFHPQRCGRHRVSHQLFANPAAL